MAGKPRWKTHREDGVLTITLRSWKVFGDCLSKYVQSISEYIYRGQASEDWLLEPTLDRILRDHGPPNAPISILTDRHLEEFKLAVRGRRGPNPAALIEENEWWALGQHHGLATPLLDWTRSPYVAAYFAFVSPHDDGAQYRAVFGLQRSIIQQYCDGGVGVEGYLHPIIPPSGINVPLPSDDRIEVFSPHADENSRLVNQGGLFTRSPAGVDVESWMRKHFTGIKLGFLVKILIPTRDRVECLQALNRMNINHLTLFPDLYGSSKYCNHRLTIRNY